MLSGNFGGENVVLEIIVNGETLTTSLQVLLNFLESKMFWVVLILKETLASLEFLIIKKSSQSLKSCKKILP